MRPAARLAGPIAALACALVGTGAAAGPAAAQSVWTPVGTAPPAAGWSRVLAPAPGGGATVVSATDEIYEGPGDLTVDRLTPGRPAVRWIGRRLLLLDHARGADDTLDLLVAEGGGPGDARRALALLRVERSGAVRRLWRTTEAGGVAALARTGSRLAVAWLRPATRQRPQALRLVAGTARGLGRARTVGRVLPAFLRGADPGYVGDLDIGLDRGGRPTFALTAWSPRAEVLVLASTSARGALRHRQVTRGPQGLVDVQTTPGGRMAVLTEDTGVEGEVGECVSDHDGRRIWATLREPGARRFTPTQLLDELPLACAASGAQLVAGAGDSVAVLWGTADEGRDPAPPAVRVARAAPGARFGRRAAPMPGARLEAAAPGPAGGLLILARTPAGSGAAPPAGPLVAERRAADGTRVGAEVLQAAGSAGALAASGPGGRLLAAWTLPDGSRRVVAAAG